MPALPADRDRWLALGLLLAVVAFAYLVLVLPWWPVPMQQAGHRISTLQDRELRLRSPLVLRCVDDYLRGLRRPLESVARLDLASASSFVGVTV